MVRARGIWNSRLLSHSGLLPRAACHRRGHRRYTCVSCSLRVSLSLWCAACRFRVPSGILPTHRELVDLGGRPADLTLHRVTPSASHTTRSIQRHRATLPRSTVRPNWRRERDDGAGLGGAAWPTADCRGQLDKPRDSHASIMDVLTTLLDRRKGGRLARPRRQERTEHARAEARCQRVPSSHVVVVSTGGPVLLSTTMSSLMSRMRNASGVSATLSKPAFQLPGALTGEHPTRPHLHAVQEFFRYTEYQGAILPGSPNLGQVRRATSDESAGELVGGDWAVRMDSHGDRSDVRRGAGVLKPHRRRFVFPPCCPCGCTLKRCATRTRHATSAPPPHHHRHGRSTGLVWQRRNAQDSLPPHFGTQASGSSTSWMRTRTGGST